MISNTQPNENMQCSVVFSNLHTRQLISVGIYHNIRIKTEFIMTAANSSQALSPVDYNVQYVTFNNINNVKCWQKKAFTTCFLSFVVEAMSSTRDFVPLSDHKFVFLPA